MKNTVLFTASMLIFGTIGLFRRMIPLSSGHIALFRGLLGAAVLFLWVRLRGEYLRHGIGRRKACLLILSGCLIGFNWILLFEAYRYTTVSIATLCYYMQPTLVLLASLFLFREPLTLKKGLCTLMSLAGMLLISGVLEGASDSPGNGLGILCGLGAAALYAGVVLLNKSVRGVDAYEKTVIQLFCAGAVMIPYLLLTGEGIHLPSDARTLLLLLLVGTVHTGLAYAMYFGSMEGLPTQTVAQLSYVDPLSALLLSAAFLGDRLTLLGWLGAALILGSALWSEWKRPVSVVDAKTP